MNRVLVTGASGFIGSRLTRRALELGLEVHGVSRSDRDTPGVHWHHADVTDATAVQRLVNKVEPDVVYHLASHVSGSSEPTAIHPTFETNVGGAVAVFDAAREYGCRVVLAGSDKELGVGSDRAPGSPYAASKVSATAYGRMFHQSFGLSIVNLRVFMVYGGGQLDSTKLVPYTVGSLLSGTSPALTQGARRFDWIYVDDVIDAFVAAGTAAGGDDGAPIDVGSGRLTSIRKLVEEIARSVDTEVEPSYGTIPERPPEPGFAADLSIARRLLGWTPQTHLIEGVRKTVAWYESHVHATVRGALFTVSCWSFVVDQAVV